MARSWEDRNRGSLSIGGLQPFVFTWSDTQIVAVVTPGTTSGLVQVSQGGQTSNSLNFIVAAPNITGVSPVNGAPGTQVTFSGSGFGASQGTGNLDLQLIPRDPGGEPGR